ncbi:MAG: glyoxylate/hydroxypyruvate reductase A [Burkholderiales bacterium]|nr:glyoxylate/hydroxypyruvate reductase A [Burkholderiales bacterium]
MNLPSIKKFPVIPFVAPSDYAHTLRWINALQQAMPHERILPLQSLSAEERAQCTVAIVANPDPDDLKSLPNLRWIHSVWAGVERLVDDLGASSLKIVRLVDPQLAETMAEAVLAWTLYLHRDMPAYAQQQMARRWHAQDYVRPQRKTVSLLGLGALGEAAARRLLGAGFQVSGWSRTQKNLSGVDCYSGSQGLQTMLNKTDILICLLPLTAETRELLNAMTLAYLPAHASLINFARGRIINDDDLRSALDAGRLQHAVLDVFATEPLPPDQWHWTHPKVTVLPHCSAPTDRETASQIVANNMRVYREHGRIPEHIDVQRGY